MTEVTPDLVRSAYAALGSGDMAQLEQYWDESMRWLVPGQNQLSGWKEGRDGFLGFMQRVGELSGNSFNMEWLSINTSDEYSADVTHNTGSRADDPSKQLDIEVVHVLRWRDGKVIEGKGAIFGNGTAQYDWFWS